MRMSTGGDSTPAALHRMAAWCTDVLARLLPAGLLRSLAGSIARQDPQILTRTVTTVDRSLMGVRLPDRISGFEDLAFLFWATPMNRGVLRQDFDEAAALYRLVSSLPEPRGVEIGRYAGGSTLLIAAALSDAGGLLTSIDIAPQDDVQLHEVLTRLDLVDHVDLRVGDAAEVEWNEPLDFVFIDGDHSYQGAYRDHSRWGARVKVGGYIIHHDMGQARSHATGIPELMELRHDIEMHQAGELEVVEEAGSLVVFRRVSDAWTSFAESR